MSYQANTQYAETAWDRVESAIEAHDFSLAYKIANSTDSVGFTFLAGEMKKAIDTAKGLSAYYKPMSDEIREQYENNSLNEIAER